MLSRTLGSSVCFGVTLPKILVDRPELIEFSQALYSLLLAHADDFGRQEGNIETVRFRVFPTSHRTEDEFGAALNALAQSELIEWYDANKQSVIAIRKWDSHQTGLHKRTKSKFPDPPSDDGGASTFPAVEATSGESKDGTLYTDRSRQIVERFSTSHLALRKQPYMASRVQQERDLYAAQTLSVHYTDDQLGDLIEAFLRVPDESSPILKNGQRTLPMLVVIVPKLANLLGFKAVTGEQA
jgi:hypothetical protein